MNSPAGRVHGREHDEMRLVVVRLCGKLILVILQSQHTLVLHYVVLVRDQRVWQADYLQDMGNR